MANLEAVPKMPATEQRLKVPEASRRSVKAVAPEPAAPEWMAGEDRYRMIAEAAYFRAERRGFHPGSEIEDWLAAEIEVDGNSEGR